MKQEDKSHPPTPQPRMPKLKIILIIVFTAALMPLAFVGFDTAVQFYNNFFEISKPRVEVLEAPRGVGVLPVRFKMALSDVGAGLDEVVVRTRQRSVSLKLLSKKLEGATEATLEFELDGAKQRLAEGPLEVEIRVFDRSFWSNASERVLSLSVDYRKPKIEVLTTQHNARTGGSQLVFYKAFDEDLAVSGVKIAGVTFEGIPAKGLDSELQEPGVYAAVYGVGLGQPASKSDVRVFAEDRVGNAVSKAFYNKILNKNFPSYKINIEEQFLRSRVVDVYDTVRNEVRSLGLLKDGGNLPLDSNELLIERFCQLISRVKPLNDSQIAAFLKGPRYESFLDGPFLKPTGSLSVPFGSKVTYFFERKQLCDDVSYGHVMTLPLADRRVYATQDGIVIGSENFGVYGRSLLVDHGFGLVSMYGQLNSVVVAKGEMVKKGQELGLGGVSGLARSNGYVYQLRLHGVPVDPIEWSDVAWFRTHVLDKISEAKRALGLTVYVPFAR